MSSYLTFYAVPKRENKEEPKKRLVLTAYSRSSDVYQYFHENLHVAYAADDTENSYTTLTSSDISTVLEDIRRDIQRAKDRLVEYEKYASTNAEYINDIIDTKKLVSELQYVEGKIAFLEDMVEDISAGCSSFEELCCNIG